MKRFKLLSVYCLMAVFTMFFAACSSDDEPGMQGDTPPEALIGTWNMDGESSITFRANGTGEIKTEDYADEHESPAMYAPKFKIPGKPGTGRDLITISFTWNYSAADRRITISAQGETMIWNIISLSDGNLVVKDSDGDEMSMQKSADENPDTPDTPGDPEIGATELLYCAWGAAGTKAYEFTKDGYVRMYYKDEETGATKYDNTPFRYDEKTHVISIEEMPGDGFFQVWKVKVLTPTVICLSYVEGGGDVYLSRIGDNEENTIGALSLIYDKELTLMGTTEKMTMTIRANGKVTIAGMTVDYKYNESTHLLTLSAYGEPINEFTVIRLTEDVIFLENKYNDEDGVHKSIVEYRAI